ncbi:MAG: HAMP domain-containing histidine kinase [Prevotella sp.]|nr:HAMP domain-containing histidine kinase [Prevotella sp.]
MKKRTIIVIALIMGLSFAALLFLQLTYMRSITRMKREQFDESAGRALYQAARNLELNETLHYLEKDINSNERRTDTINRGKNAAGTGGGALQPTHQFSVTGEDGTPYTAFERRILAAKPATMPKGIIFNSDKNAVSEASRSMQEILHNRYLYQKALLDELIYRMLYTASETPLEERINFKQLDQDLKAELMSNGLNVPYHFSVVTRDGREVYRCPDYVEGRRDIVYTQQLFRNDTQAKPGLMKVRFPDMGDYIYNSVKFMIPSLIFTLILFVTFIFTIVVVFRQKKVSEMRNDFINNMTHELKTPISSISLASQMLADKKLKKSEQMVDHLGGIVSSEVKRLRFLVEKVLQMSMFDRQKAIYNRKDVDMNEMVETIAKTFHLRVGHTGGHITTDIEAVDSVINVDEMHFQNVIFNLLDNAVKYCREDTPLELFIKTWNPDEKHVALMVKDNGTGIKKEDLKKIFDKFYRVHTGNVHDVKGFGLGLAYVKQIVSVHGGEIRAESEYRKGTTFTITMRVVPDEA